MAGEDNLIPFNERTEDEQREIAKQGGIASGEARRKKKLIKETIIEMLDMPLKKGELSEVETFGDAKSKRSNLTVQEAMVAALFKRALSGDTFAFSALRDTIGQKPTDKVEHTGDIPIVIMDDIRE